MPVDLAHVPQAEEGRPRSGTSRGPPVVAVFGDLFAYGPTRQLDLSLPFKGNDFRRTGVGLAS